MSTDQETDADRIVSALAEIAHAMRDLYALGAAAHLLNPAHAAISLGAVGAESYEVMEQRTDLAAARRQSNEARVELEGATARVGDMLSDALAQSALPTSARLATMRAFFDLQTLIEGTPKE